MPQVLHLLNGESIPRRVADGEGRLAGSWRGGVPTAKLPTASSSPLWAEFRPTPNGRPSARP